MSVQSIWNKWATSQIQPVDLSGETKTWDLVYVNAAVTDLIFLASKITVGSDCSHEIKSCLLLGRKAMTNLDSILKSRDTTLPTTVHSVKTTVFPVVMYGCESWTIKKAEHQRNDAFKLWCWRRLLRVPWTAKSQTSKSSSKSTLNIHWKNWCWSWSSNALVTWCKELTHWKRPWCWERLKAGGEGGDREWDGWMASLTQWTRVWANSGSDWQRSLARCNPWGHKESDTTERLNNNGAVRIFLSTERDVQSGERSWLMVHGPVFIWNGT